MKFRFAALLALLLGTAPLAAETPARPPAPKLLIILSVDQFSAKLFTDYRSHFTGGLRRLADGVVFANGYQPHGITQTCPGHAAIATGMHPARTGIIANNWYDFAAARANKSIYCAEDETAQSFIVSSRHLRVPTLGDRLKQSSPSSRVVAVTGKDRTAAMLGGRIPDQRWWWRDDRFVQNSVSMPPPVAAQVNGAVAQAIAQARAPLVPPDFCAARDMEYAVAGQRVGTFRFQRAAGDAAAFSSGPELDAATLTLAAALVQQLQLGRGGATDLLGIGLSATDLVGHRYGPAGLEMCLQLASLDKDLRDFFAFLDQSGVDYAVVLTADHGSLDMPERLQAQGVADAARVDPAAIMQEIGRDVGQKLGLGGPVFIGPWYIAPTVPAARRPQVIALARQLLRAHPQVHSVYSATEVGAQPMPKSRPESWSVLERLRASFDPTRFPDLTVVYKPNVTPTPTRGVVATHGSVWDHDRKVPILFWWPGIAAQDRPESAMAVDIMPTLASLIGLKVPEKEIDGRCIDLLPGAANNCQ